jgi:MraZ protein
VEGAGIPGVHNLKGKVAHMFLGQYQHSIDEKGRLMIPARFRELLVGGAYVMQGLDRCLMVMTSAYFEEVYRRISSMNIADPTARLLRRLILASAYPAEVDKVGRVLLPAVLRQSAQLEGEAIVAGTGEYFEVWSPAGWVEQMNQLQDTEANNQRFAALDLSAHS